MQGGEGGEESVSGFSKQTLESFYVYINEWTRRVIAQFSLLQNQECSNGKYTGMQLDGRDEI